MFTYEIKFLTSDNSLQLKTGDFNSLKYETRKRVEESFYDAGKRSFCERRGGHWRAPKPRQLRQLEAKVAERGVVFCEWMHENIVTIIFSSGVIGYLTVKPQTLDVTQVLFDRHCVGKLAGQTVTGVMLCKTHLLFTHADRMGTLLTFGKIMKGSQPCRIADRDPHFQTVELGGARRAERRMSWCESSNAVRLLVWGASSAEPAPWSPVLEDLANLHLYQIQGQHVTLIAHHQLENETLLAELSNKCDNVIHIVEQLANNKNGVTLNWIRYEVNADERSTKLSTSRDSVTQVSLAAWARVTRLGCDCSRLLVACIDGSLHVVHCLAGLTNSTKAGFISTDVRWAGELIIAAEETGRLQCFDKALALIHNHTKCIDLTTYSRDSKRLQILAHTAVRGGPLLLASFCGGPLFLLRIMHPRLLTAWIRGGRPMNAVALLQGIDWEVDGTEGLWAVNKLVCESLRAGLHSEADEATVQAALGSFLAPRAPLGPCAQRLAPPLHDLARKFFHHLLRRGRVEKALSLAVDLADWDLFMDARWMAARRDMPELADEAANLALTHCSQHDSECSESCSQCSSHSYTESDNETSASSEITRTKPPPLPRIPKPEDLTMVPVTTNNDPISTNSIRPNLHQYLERDNTIWNTDVREDTHIPPKTHPLASNIKWHSVDNFLTSYNKSRLVTINESNTTSTKIQWPQEEKGYNYKPVYLTERQELPNNFYRYHTSINYLPSTSGDVNRNYSRYDASGPERPLRSVEKNKVKFADTVTVTVVPESPLSTIPCPSRELADSLPLCPPHKYLAAFTPQTPRAPAEMPAKPKIKVVHFGMV